MNDVLHHSAHVIRTVQVTLPRHSASDKASKVFSQ